MIAYDLYIAYVLATTALVLMPGPIVTLTVANSLAHGAGRGVLTVAGATAGSGVLLACGALGLAWVLSELSEWVNVIRWVGAAYLIFLGVRQWRSKPVDLDDAHADKGRVASVVLHGFVVAVTNPKTILFYAAFFPQFIDTARPLEPQLWIMSATFLVIGFSLDSGYAMMAGRLRRWLSGANKGRLRNRITGSLLMITGAGLALVRR
ncbi:MAG: LysE family translocator [Rhodospirillaceae bacterium]|jgi:homoserine/homoserine lactone efflux protein|nr:LysE family translocator [Rhodospirillaceae bacterium]